MPLNKKNHKIKKHFIYLFLNESSCYVLIVLSQFEHCHSSSLTIIHDTRGSDSLFCYPAAQLPM